MEKNIKEILELNNNCTYLVSKDFMDIIKIVVINKTKTSYEIEKYSLNNVLTEWILIKSFHEIYNIIEDITEYLQQKNIIIPPEYEICPICHGKGKVPFQHDSFITCPCCNGNKIKRKNI